jgi:hypothetical protein
MKIKNTMGLVVIGALALVTLVTLATGCATSKDKQATQQQRATMLLASGFKAIPATTPDQQQQIKILPADRVSAVKRMGKVYFVFPDRARNVLYVGNNHQYLQYQAQAQNAQEQMQVKYEMEAINRSQASRAGRRPGEIGMLSKSRHLQRTSRAIPQ